MQHIQRSFVTAHGLDMAYVRVGSGPPVVYLHGAVTTLEEGLLALHDVLADDFTLIAFDRPGHGESGRDPTTGSASRQADILHEALRVLEIERPVVIGHSFGGAVALALALRSPEDLTGVVAVAPIAFPEARLETLLLGPRALPGFGDWQSWMARPSDALIMPALYRAMFLPQAMPEAFEAGFPFALASGRTQLQADGQEALAMATSLGFNALRYGACRVPVHILHGERDLVVNPLMHARPLAAVLPRAELTSLPGLGHMAHHFAPEAVADAVCGLFADQGAAPAQPERRAAA